MLKGISGIGKYSGTGACKKSGKSIITSYGIASNSLRTKRSNSVAIHEVNQHKGTRSLYIGNPSHFPVFIHQPASRGYVRHLPRVLGVAAVYLFQINPFLCVVVAGLMAFFKVRGIIGNQHDRVRAGASPATEAALVATCLTLLERAERVEREALRDQVTSRSKHHEDDSLGRLFLW
jgi:hypothetical protein